MTDVTYLLGGFWLFFMFEFNSKAMLNGFDLFAGMVSMPEKLLNIYWVFKH